MKMICDRVNLIPVIGKSDSLTASELLQFKKSVQEKLTNTKILTYDFQDEEYELNPTLPFAIVGSNMKENDRRFRISQIGKIDISNRDICDYSIVETILLGSHLQELKDVTQLTLYEKFREERLSKSWALQYMIFITTLHKIYAQNFRWPPQRSRPMSFADSPRSASVA